MNTTSDCPDIDALWPVAVGEFVEPEVERHLESCDQCMATLADLLQSIASARRYHEAQPADGLAESLRILIPEALQPAEVAPPDRLMRLPMIGKYVVLETLSEGGQSTVYRALHPSLLIEVAVKWSRRRHIAGRNERARLESEAKRLAGLRHPHLARVYDLGVADDRPFLVMELIRGEDLRSFRIRSAITSEQILRLTARVARAVSEAHEAGILHLDLKPENIMINRDHEPILIDFGLSSLPRRVAEPSPSSQVIAGTPGYMAPEQARGSLPELSTQTDIYGLGGVLFFLLTGEAPFGCDDWEGGGPIEPLKPDFTRLASSGVSAKCRQICERAMAMSADERFTSASEMADALDAEADRLANVRCRRLRLAALVAAIMAAGSMISAASLSSRPDAKPRAELDVAVSRDGDVLKLTGALSPRPEDAIALTSVLDETRHLALVALQAERPPVWCRPLQIEKLGSRARMTFPRNGRFIECGNTEAPLVLILLVRGVGPIRESEANWMAQLPDCPTIPQSVAVNFSGTDVRVVGPATMELLAEITAWRDTVHDHLRERVDGFRGIILPACQPDEAIDARSEVATES